MEIGQSIKGFPDPLALFETKKSNPYGLQIAGLIASEWFGGNGVISGNCQFHERRLYIRNKRLLVRGEQDTSKYKKLLGKEDDGLEFLNLDFSNINLAQKFCRIVSSGISDENYRLDIRSNNAIALKYRKEKKDQLEKARLTKPMLEKAKEVLGIDLVPKGIVPEDEEETEMLLEMGERPKIEIGEEVLIDYIKETNDWYFIEQQKNIDLVDIGIAGVRVFTDPNDGVKVVYVDPEHYVHSRVSRNDFADKYYEGVVDTITISDLRREANGEITEDEIRLIAKLYGSANGNKDLNFNTCNLDLLIDYKIDVLRFAWKTSKTRVFKKKLFKGKTSKLIEKKDSYIAPNVDNVSSETSTLDTWFEGNFIVGSNVLYGYQECENLTRDKMNKAMSPFVMRATKIYENRLQSFLSDIEPILHEMQTISLNLQKLLSEVKPDLINIDINQLAELDDGKGGSKRAVWKTALTLMQQKGVVFSKRIDLGEPGKKDGMAVSPLPQQQGSGITTLMNAWAFKYNLIRDITGVNEARDGSLGQEALLGVNQLAQMASNTATKYIVDASIGLNKKVNELISTRILSIYRNKQAEHIKSIYTNVIGAKYLDALEFMADRHLHEFGFTFRMMPTNEQLKAFSDDLTLAIQEQSIDPEVKSEATMLAKTNIKLATKYLFYQRRKKIKQRQEEQMMMAKDKSQNDAMAAQAKVAAETQAFQTKAEIEIHKAVELSRIKLQEAQQLIEINKPVVEDKFNKDMQLAQVVANVKINETQFKEDRKDDRTKIQATQQSKMVDQRNKDGMPIDFENEPTFEDMFAE